MMRRPATRLNRQISDGLRFCGRARARPYAIPNDRAYLEFVVAEKALDAAPLRPGVLGMNAPFLQRLLRFEFDNRYPLPVFGNEALVGDVAGNRTRQLAHMLCHGAILFFNSRIEPGAKYG